MWVMVLGGGATGNMKVPVVKTTNKLTAGLGGVSYERSTVTGQSKVAEQNESAATSKSNSGRWWRAPLYTGIAAGAVVAAG